MGWTSGWRGSLYGGEGGLSEGLHGWVRVDIVLVLGWIWPSSNMNLVLSCWGSKIETGSLRLGKGDDFTELTEKAREGLEKATDAPLQLLWGMVLCCAQETQLSTLLEWISEFEQLLVCYNFLPFSCVLPCLCSTISLLPLRPFIWGDWPLLTCLPVVFPPLYHSSLVPYLITGLSLPLIISLAVVMFSQYSTKFYNLLLR